jgi:enamine deaminase RidA (YjgF/YER057c/UK114 family)
MSDIERIEVGPRMSQAVVHGDLVFLAGQVALKKPGAGAAAQTEAILAQIDALLAEAGTDKSRLLQAQIWLADMADFADMNSVWDAWVVPGSPPARACVEAKLATPDFTVEIMVVAAK